MYTALGGNRFARWTLLGLAILIYLLAWKVTPAGSLWQIPHSALKAVGIYTLAISLFFGSSSYWAPWRILWRQFPALNQYVFPDLNGLWLGHTSSNWPVIKATREAAAGAGGANMDHVAGLPLLKGEIAMEIKASLFWISIRSKLASTNGESHSIFATVTRAPIGEDFDLIYLYRQVTPNPEATDEESHVGAGELHIRREHQLDGAYWTRRKWRAGLNTAGRIELKLVSEKHVGATADLLLKAQALST